MSQSIADLQARIDAALEHARSIANTAPKPQCHAATKLVQALQTELSEAICAGARPCPRCKRPPQGMIQHVAIKHAHYEAFEIGCSLCPRTDDHNPVAFGMTREDAVSAWNEGRWQPPKPRGADGRLLQMASVGKGD